MFHTSYSIPRFDPSIKRWLKSQIVSNMVKKFQNIKYNPGLVTLQRNENWVAYEARKETVEERASEVGPFERRERTQKANTVTDAEGNCWVANRNMKCRNVERRAKKLNSERGENISVSHLQKRTALSLSLRHTASKLLHWGHHCISCYLPAAGWAMMDIKWF